MLAKWTRAISTGALLVHDDYDVPYIERASRGVRGYPHALPGLDRLLPGKASAGLRACPAPYAILR